MIAVSSHRPHSDSEEYAQNQRQALRSWLPVFSLIIYLGSSEPSLENEKVIFKPSDPWPRIKDLVLVAASQKADYIVLINADIVLSPSITTVVELMKHRKVKAGVSRRYEFDPELKGKQTYKLVDYGLDVFICTPMVWRMVANVIPNAFRLGHPNWDGWLIGYLNSHLKSAVVDFTAFRAIMHPKHGGRKTPFQSEINVKDFYLKFAAIPGRKLI